MPEQSSPQGKGLSIYLNFCFSGLRRGHLAQLLAQIARRAGWQRASGSRL